MGEGFLGLGDRLVVEPGDQAVGRAPGFCRRFAHDHVEADAERQRSAPLGRQRARCGDFPGDVAWWFAPGEVDVDMFGGERGCRRPDEPPK